jgi:hypothetical protein
LHKFKFSSVLDVVSELIKQANLPALILRKVVRASRLPRRTGMVALLYNLWRK